MNVPFFVSVKVTNERDQEIIKPTSSLDDHAADYIFTKLPINRTIQECTLQNVACLIIALVKVQAIFR